MAEPMTIVHEQPASNAEMVLALLPPNLPGSNTLESNTVSKQETIQWTGTITELEQTTESGVESQTPVFTTLPISVENQAPAPSDAMADMVSAEATVKVPTIASRKAFIPEGVELEQDGMVILGEVKGNEPGQHIILQQSDGQLVIQSSQTPDPSVQIPENVQVEEIGAEELEREFQKQDAQKSHQCHTCGETFFMYLELLRHVMSAHSNALPSGQSGKASSQENHESEETIYECSECKLRFNKVVHLNEHIGLHFAMKKVGLEAQSEPAEEEMDEESKKLSQREENKKFACDMCDKRFTRSFSLKSHMLVHEGVKPFTCEVCSKSFREHTKLKNHMAVHADAKPHICAICAKAFAAAAYLRTHMMIHTGKKPYKCTDCNMAFISSGNLKRHSRIHTGEKPFKCDFCGAAFAQMGNLESHKRTHTGVRPYECEICGKGFMQSSGLVEHIRTHSGAKPYTCDTCGRSFAGSSGLRVHKRTHTGERPHECDICFRRFAASGNLKTHRKIHTNERPFKCEYCGKGFVASGNLSQHVRIHTGEKPYKCNICEKAFAGTGGLKIHMMGHYDEKPFSCEYCDKGFKTKQKMAAHIFYHTGERPHVCTICEKGFTLSEKLKAHIRNKHSESVIPPSGNKKTTTSRPREPADYEDLGPPVLSPQPLEPVLRIRPTRTKFTSPSTTDRAKQTGENNSSPTGKNTTTATQMEVA